MGEGKGGKINMCRCACVDGGGVEGEERKRGKCSEQLVDVYSPNQQSCPCVLMRADTLLPEDDFTKGPNGAKWFSNMGKKWSPVIPLVPNAAFSAFPKANTWLPSSLMARVNVCPHDTCKIVARC